jgi:ribosomal protein S18 acetylase RimI-like enzyme
VILVQEIPGGPALEKAREAAARMELLDAFLVRADLDRRQIDDTRVWLGFEPRSGDLRAIVTLWAGIGLPALAVATPPAGWDDRVAREALAAVRDTLRRSGPEPPWLLIDTRAREPAYKDAFTVRDRREELHMVLPDDVALPLAEVPVEPVGEADLAKLDAFLQAHGATAWSPRSFEAGRYVWVRKGDDVVAAAGIHFETDDVGQIANVLVRKDARREGLGRAVTVAVARRIRAAGKVASLFVRSDNDAAIALYEKLGFKTVRRMASLTVA